MSNDSDVHAKGKAVNSCRTSVLGSEQKCKLDDVLFVPGQKYSLLSVVRMTKFGCEVTFEGTTGAIS